MARYKPVDSRMKLLPVDLSRQLLPGTFEHALSLLIDEEFDLNALHTRVKNDLSGAPRSLQQFERRHHASAR